MFMVNIKLSRSNFIHLLRWTAACLVVFNHMRSIIFKDFDQVSNKGPSVKLFYFITSLGHQAVIVFFVLSGYLVAGSVINQLKKGIFDIKNYAINRFSRLYAVLLVALILTVILDNTGIYLDHIGLYTHQIKTATLDYSVESRESAKYFFASLFMLQTIVLPPLGSNSPLWSLSYEFWYYVLFPCIILCAIFVKGRKKMAAVPFVLLALMIAFLPFNILQYFLIWLLGLIPFYFSAKGRYYKYVLMLVFVGWLAFKKGGNFEPFYYDLILGLIVAFWVSSFQNRDQPLANTLLKLNEKLSSFSYSIYLIHFPIIMLILTVIVNYTLTGIKLEPDAMAYIVFVFVFSIVIMGAYAIATFTEHKTPQFRQKLKCLLATQKGRSFYKW